jgi:hypothetical protein
MFRQKSNPGDKYERFPNLGGTLGPMRSSRDRTRSSFAYSSLWRLKDRFPAMRSLVGGRSQSRGAQVVGSHAGSASTPKNVKRPTVQMVRESDALSRRTPCSISKRTSCR